MFRYKITELTILHCNRKITYLVRENKEEGRRQVHKHILEGLMRIVTEGLLYLLKVSQLVGQQIVGYGSGGKKEEKEGNEGNEENKGKESILSELKVRLNADQSALRQ